MVLATPHRQGVKYGPGAAKLAAAMLPSYSAGQLDQLYQAPKVSGDAAFSSPQETVDITSKMSADGTLEWDAPVGKWDVIRFGYQLGRQTHPDLFMREALDYHLAQKLEPMVAQSKSDIGQSWIAVHQDSYEAGQQTWTEAFPREFQRLRGYDMRPWMPVLAGHLVGSPALSDRFLHDYRQTISDLYVENWYGRFAERLKGMGLKFTTEGGYGWASPVADGLRIEALADVPMGEDWMAQHDPRTGKMLAYQLQVHHLDKLNLSDVDKARGIPNGLGLNSVRLASSAAHTYGREYSAAETFTSYTRGGYDGCNSPYSAKTRGDLAFCDGLGRVVFHCYTLQPEEGKPGYLWPGIGLHFTRNTTWWEFSHAFVDYLSRCQVLLRQGKFVADFAYWTGDTMPYECPDRIAMRPELPPGCNADLVNTDVLVKQMRVEDGRLVLPSSISYRYLVLPPTRETVDPKSLEKIVRLVEAGANIVLGPRPVSAVGLQDYPRCDEAVKTLADRLWGTGQQEPAGRRSVGKGRVYWGMALADILKADGVPQDCVMPVGMRDWIHRRAGNQEIYFLSNQGDGAVESEVTFRVKDMQPELWDPVTGERRALPEYRSGPETTAIPLAFAPRQSFFIVFKERSQASGGSPQNGGKNFPVLNPIQELTGPWDVTFDDKWFYPDNGTGGRIRFDQLEDWSKRPEDSVKYFSGKATYRKTSDCAAGSLAGKSGIYLDLGVVKDIAAVRLNGQDLGVVWCAPWRVKLDGKLKENGNVLEIDVINCWPNRLIGDSRLPTNQRRTQGATLKQFVPDSPLLPSGLLGPVRLLQH